MIVFLQKYTYYKLYGARKYYFEVNSFYDLSLFLLSVLVGGVEFFYGKWEGIDFFVSTRHVGITLCACSCKPGNTHYMSCFILEQGRDFAAVPCWYSRGKNHYFPHKYSPYSWWFWWWTWQPTISVYRWSKTMIRPFLHCFSKKKMHCTLN